MINLSQFYTANYTSPETLQKGDTVRYWNVKRTVHNTIQMGKLNIVDYWNSHL